MVVRLRYISLLAIIFLFSFVYGQDDIPQWRVWLYQPDTASMTRVNAKGEEERKIQIPGLQVGTSPINIVISPSGNLIAYLIRDGDRRVLRILSIAELNPVNEQAITEPPPTPDLDVVTPSPVFGYPLQGDVPFTYPSLTPANFDDDESTFVFGYNLANQAGWVIVVIDTASETILRELRSDNAIVANAGINLSADQTIFVRSELEDKIYFTLVNDNDLDNVAGNYVWDTATNEIFPSPAYQSLDALTLEATNEVIAPRYDPDFSTFVRPQRDEHYPNTAYVFSSTSASNYPIYAQPAPVVRQIFFVQGGEGILINTMDGWNILDRQGSIRLLNLPDMRSVENVLSTSNGFVYSETQRLADGMAETRLHEVIIGEDVEDRIVWRGSQAHLLWVGEPTQNLGNMSSGWTAIESEFKDDLLAVGRGVEIQTEFGSTMNLRSDRGTAANKLLDLQNGDHLIIVDGPREVDGFRWWRVLLPESIYFDSGYSDGWVVDEVNDFQTLILSPHQ